MANSVVLKVTLVVVACMLVAAPYAAEALSCSQVVSSLNPCLYYLRMGGIVPPACCNGVRSVKAADKSPVDRQTTCGCLKQASSSLRIKPGFASALPSKCGVSVGYPISSSVDCSKVR